MAGTADSALNRSVNSPLDAPPNPEEPSLPLYLAGSMIALCGTLAANEALARPDYEWMKNSLLLTGLGFVFSYGCRRLGIRSQVVDFGLVAVVVLLLAGIVGGHISLEQFLPVGSDAPNFHLIVVLVWGGTFWAWALRSDNRVMGMAVPAMAILGLAASVDFNDPILICFGVFILTVIFLLIHQNFLQARSRAAGAARMAASSRLLLAQFTQAGLCSLAVLLVGMVVIIPAQAVFARLSLAQAIRRLANIKTPGLPGSTARSFSDEDTLDIGTGTAWSSSAETMMQVTPSDGREHYWRGRTYDLYTGIGWQSSMEEDKVAAEGPFAAGDRERYRVRPNLTPGDENVADAVPTLTATFQVFGDTNQFYYAANPRQVLLEPMAIRYNQGLRICDDGRLDLLSSLPVRLSYTIISLPAPDVDQPETQSRLRRAGTDYPPLVRSLYLGVQADGVTQPGDVTFFQQAVADAVQDLPPNRRDPLDEALALREWVSRRCTYSLTPPPIPDDADHVRIFLDENRRGYCDLFASSLTILCREAHIPARLATGFAPGEPNGSSFNLRGEDKHAWTEVYFPGAGWVALDATVGSATDGSVPNAGKPGRGGWPGWLRRLRVGLSTGRTLVFPLLAVIVLLVGYVLKTELYGRWRANRPGVSGAVFPAPLSPTALGRQFRRLAHALVRLGLARRPSETPGEHAARAAIDLPVLEREFDVSLSRPLLIALTDAFAQACYGRPGTPAVEVEQWEGALGEFEAAARRVFWVRQWRWITHWGRTVPRMIPVRQAGQSQNPPLHQIP